MKKFIFVLFFVFLFCPIFVFAEQIDINTATLSQLDKLTGIGPKYAQAIIDARPFSSVDDLLRVKGIGPKTLQKIKDQGLAYVTGPTQQLTEITQVQNATATEPITATTSPANAELLQTPVVTYPGGVFINEILPNPQGPDETDEWIELYNYNNFDVDLSNWQLQDTQGTITTYTILKDTKISANGFLIFKRPDTKIMLNNDEDGLNLLTPDTKIVDSVVFVKAPLNQSYNKTSSGWQWSATLTPGATNILATITTKTLSKTKNSVKNNNVDAGLADISRALNTNQEETEITNPWFLFFSALAITIGLAAVVLFIKLKVFKKHVGT